jgi:competence protein ComEC
MLKNGLILLLGFLLLLRIPSIDFSKDVDSSINISIPFIEHLRETLIRNATQLLPEKEAGLLLGMVIGVKEEIPWKFNQTLKNTGVVHVVVVSGQNLTLLAGFILGFSPYLGRKKTILLSMGVVFFYLFLTGFQIPVLRASVMFFMASFAKLYGREGDSFRILLITALAMLLYNPLWISSISFQLSFLATIGVVVLAPELIKRINFIPSVLKQDLLVTFSAQLLTAPIIAFYFNQFSIVGLFVNALVLWTVPLIMIIGGLVLVSSLISITLASILIIIPNILLTYFISVVNIFNKPWASSYINTFSIPQLVGIYIMIGSFFLWIAKKKKDDSNETFDEIIG